MHMQQTCANLRQDYRNSARRIDWAKGNEAQASS
jgi:hypothetical protein